MEVWIRRTVYSKFNYKYNELIQNIINYLNFNNYSGKGILTRKTYPIHLLEQVGGVKKEIKLKDGYTYEYHIDEIIPVDRKHNRLCFVNIDESQDYCACLLYNTKKSGKTVLRIEGIFNGEDCIKCTDKNNKYKVGNILMQVIEIVKTKKEFEHITEIELSDTSIKKCYGIGINLKHLRTITHGEPYYAKYGFRPYEKKAYEIYRYNRKLYKEYKAVDNKVVDKIFENTKVINNKKPYLLYIKKYKKYILKTNPVDVKLLINKIISNGDSEDIDIETRKSGCELLSYTIVPLYIALGYKEYVDDNGTSLGDIWTLQIR